MSWMNSMNNKHSVDIGIVLSTNCLGAYTNSFWNLVIKKLKFFEYFFCVADGILIP